MRVRIPWQGDAPLHTPKGTFHFKDGVSVDPLPEEVVKRLVAIYGDRIEVLHEGDDKHKEATAEATDRGVSEEGRKRGKGRRTQVS